MQVLFKQQDWAAEDWGVDQEPVAVYARKVAQGGRSTRADSKT